MRGKAELLLEAPEESWLDLGLVPDASPEADQIDHLVLGPVAHQNEDSPVVYKL